MAQLPEAGGGLDAGDDAGRAEQDEAAEDDGRAVAPVDPPGQHQEADRGDRDHRDDGGDVPSKVPCSQRTAETITPEPGRIGQRILRRRRARLRCCQGRRNASHGLNAPSHAHITPADRRFAPARDSARQR